MVIDNSYDYFLAVTAKKTAESEDLVRIFRFFPVCNLPGCSAPVRHEISRWILHL